ncbi:hypothetical protein B4U79_11522 [Dinothrombium tinctorium]|uniref:Uncharacterized protein n=1 Tax=Dinothrombium tinctorium TaxID=1965070 RepID=A0A443QG37_9ACAR|nr:hypothetical protein B4U79_11522 [Dinothrombium tinctorium]
MQRRRIFLTNSTSLLKPLWYTRHQLLLQVWYLRRVLVRFGA